MLALDDDAHFPIAFSAGLQVAYSCPKCPVRAGCARQWPLPMLKAGGAPCTRKCMMSTDWFRAPVDPSDSVGYTIGSSRAEFLTGIRADSLLEATTSALELITANRSHPSCASKSLLTLLALPLATSTSYTSTSRWRTCTESSRRWSTWSSQMDMSLLELGMCRNLGFHASAQCTGYQEAIHMVTFKYIRACILVIVPLRVCSGPQQTRTFSPE